MSDMDPKTRQLSRSFIKAADAGRVTRMKELLAEGANPRAFNDEALRMTTLYTRIKAAQFLLDLKLDPNACSTYGDAAHEECAHTYRTDRAGGHSGTAVEWAAGESSPNALQMMQLLLENGGDVSAHGNRALNIAVKEGNQEVVALLRKHGADICAVTDSTLSLMGSKADFRDQIRAERDAELKKRGNAPKAD